MSSSLVHLTKLAHAQALERGTLTPAERYEFNHLRMKRVDGVMVFDAARMRADQISETVARLQQLTGQKYAVGVRVEVESYMVTYGHLGCRIKDICSDLGASKPAVLKYLRELVDAGKVRVMETRTRGTGSRRKLYHWNDVTPSLTEEWVDYEGVELNLITDNFYTNAESGVVDHGTAMGGLVCGCGYCRFAIEEAFVGEERSAALRRGETGLSAGLHLRRVRRERLAAAYQAWSVGLAAS